MIKDLKSIYDGCKANGLIKIKSEPDIELVRSLKLSAERGLAFIKNMEKSIAKNSLDWTFVFRDYYESLRSLIDAFLLFEKVAADSHQCKNAYLCYKHPELELNWDFLETARLKRNAINYKGQLLKYEDWKKIRLNFELHINKIREEIEDRLKKLTQS